MAICEIENILYLAINEILRLKNSVFPEVNSDKRELDEQWESCSEEGISLKDLKGIDEQLRESGI